MTLRNNKALVLGAGNVAAGNLVVTAAGNITQAANTTLIVGGDATFTATNGAINLNQANAFSGNVVLSNTGTSNVTLTNNGSSCRWATSASSRAIS